MKQLLCVCAIVAICGMASTEAFARKCCKTPKVRGCCQTAARPCCNAQMACAPQPCAAPAVAAAPCCKTPKVRNCCQTAARPCCNAGAAPVAPAAPPAGQPYEEVAPPAPPAPPAPAPAAN